MSMLHEANQERVILREIFRQRRVALDKHEDALVDCLRCNPSMATIHLSRVTDLRRYLNTFNGADISRHLALLTELTDERPAVASVQQREVARTFGIDVVGNDGRGVASAVTRCLAELNLDIRGMEVVTYEASTFAEVRAAKFVIAFSVLADAPAPESPNLLETQVRGRLLQAYLHLSRGWSSAGEEEAFGLQTLDLWAHKIVEALNKAILEDYERSRLLLEQIRKAWWRKDALQLDRLLAGGEGASLEAYATIPRLVTILLQRQSEIAEHTSVSELYRALEVHLRSRLDPVRSQLTDRKYADIVGPRALTPPRLLLEKRTEHRNPADAQEGHDSVATEGNSMVQDGGRDVQAAPALRLTIEKAHAVANGYITYHYSTAYAVDPELLPPDLENPQLWTFKIVLALPDRGPLGEIGRISVDSTTGKVDRVTSANEVGTIAEQLHEAARNAVESNVLPSGAK